MKALGWIISIAGIASIGFLLGCRHTVFVAPYGLAQAYYREGDTIIFRPYREGDVFDVHIDKGFCKGALPSEISPDLEKLPWSAHDDSVRCKLLKQKVMDPGYNEIPFSYYLKFKKDKRKTTVGEGDLEGPYDGHVGRCPSCSSTSDTPTFVPRTVAQPKDGASAIIRCPASSTGIGQGSVRSANLFVSNGQQISWFTNDNSTFVITFDNSSICSAVTDTSCTVTGGTTGTQYSYTAAVSHNGTYDCAATAKITVTQ